MIELTKDLLTSQPAEGVASTKSSEATASTQGWRVGDRCMTVWNQDGQWVSYGYAHSAGWLGGLLMNSGWSETFKGRDFSVYLYSPAYSTVWSAGCMRQRSRRSTERIARQPSPSVAMATRRWCLFNPLKNQRRARADNWLMENLNQSK